MPATRRPRDAAATRRVILAAAEVLFADRGYADTSMSDISRESGVTKSLIHHHFESKKGLWEAVKHILFDEFVADIQQLVATAATLEADILAKTVRAYFEAMRRNPRTVRILSWMNMETQDDAGPGQEYEPVVDYVIQRLKEAQNSGALRKDVEPVFIVIAFFSLVEGWFGGQRILQRVFGRYLPEGDVDIAYRDALLKVFLQGVTARPR